MDGVDKLHEIQLVLIYRLRLTVNRRTVYLQCLALLDQWEIMFTVDHLFALSNPALTSALSKKSFSKVSLPIFVSIRASDTKHRASSWRLVLIPNAKTLRMH